MLASQVGTWVPPLTRSPNGLQPIPGLQLVRALDLPPGYTQGLAIRRFRSRVYFDDLTSALNRPSVHCASCTFVVSRWISFTSLRS